LKVPF